MDSKSPRLQVGQGWIGIEIKSEPEVTLTFRGYVPVLIVAEIGTGLDFQWMIGAKSIGESLEPLRIGNGGRFEGIKINVRKAGTDRFSPYEIELLSNEE